MLRRQKARGHRLASADYKAGQRYEQGKEPIPRVGGFRALISCESYCILTALFAQDYVVRIYKAAFVYQLDMRMKAKATCARMTELISFLESFGKCRTAWARKDVE